MHKIHRREEFTHQTLPIERGKSPLKDRDFLLQKTENSTLARRFSKLENGGSNPSSAEMRRESHAAYCLLDYVVDVRNKEVIVRGAIGLKNGPIDLKKRKLGGVHYSNGMKDGKSPHVFQLYLQRFFSNSCFCGVKKK
ncbi:uncharacterized protein LOC131248303 isoform X1 [Magnolia sinica]|uniref:uncharacterized protein LOC131248303 isoform X1 n=1 Tax=Magnolia sinica TaxID=86752 RepID=UPI0026582FC3|nr:uncharacterized protein LOC131248303 isoform X1 [Magnolia sinica]